MGGKIDVESKKGIGTIFTVEIPLELIEQDIHQKQEEPMHRDLAGVNVLMAEDNDLNAEYRKKGYAKKLMNMMLEDAKAENVSIIELKATEDGYSLYRSVGFEDVVAKYHNMRISL